MKSRFLIVITEALRRYFISGILAFAPLAITIWALWTIIVWLDNLILPRVLKLLIPGLDEPPPVPVIGMLFTFFVIILMGVVARHLFGGEILRIWERLLSRVPVARSIYAAVKQLVEAIFTSENANRQFRRVVMIEYPRKGIFALAFTTGPAQGIVQNLTDQHMINCFLPTTPNPTSGYYLLVPENEVHEVELSVEDAFKLVMSAGLVNPTEPEAPGLGGAPIAPPLPNAQGSLPE